MSPTIWLGESAGFGFCPKRGLAPSLGWRGWSKPRKGIPRVGATLEGHGSLSPGKEDNPNLWSKGASKEQDLRRNMCLVFIAAEDGRKRRRPEASRLEAVTGGDGAGRAEDGPWGQPVSWLTLRGQASCQHSGCDPEPAQPQPENFRTIDLGQTEDK